MKTIPNSHLFSRSIITPVFITLFLSITSNIMQLPSYTSSYNYMCANSMAPNQSDTSAEIASSYQSWKTAYVTAVGAGGYLRVQRPGDRNDTVSEGIGYGMLLAAYQKDKETLDGLWGYAKSHFNTNGLMHWHIDATNVAIDENAATDADEDMAIALIVADKTWGGYRLDATTLINNIKHHEVEFDTYVLKPGDAWGGSDVTNPSYFAPAYYKVFKEYTSDSAWDAVVDTAYQVIANIDAQTAAATTGLQPEWATAMGSPVPGMSYDYGYGATRLPWRLAKDAAWFCDTRATSHLLKINAFFRQIGASAIVDGYKLDGTVVGQYHNAAFVGTAAAASIISSDSDYKTAMWNETVSLTDGGDYQDMLRLLTLLFMSGNMPNPLTLESDTPIQTETAIPPTLIPVPTSAPLYIPLTLNPSPELWHDDFNDEQFDSRWWEVPSDSSIIYEQNGVLNLRVTTEQSREKSIYANISSVTLDEPIKEVVFATTLYSYTSAAAAGAGISVDTMSGSFLQASIGPGTNGPWLDLSVCRQSNCSTYEDFAHPPGRNIQLGIPIIIRLLRAEDKLELYVDNERIIQESTAPQLTSISFSIYAPQGKAFHVTVDDLTVKYAIQ